MVVSRTYFVATILLISVCPPAVMSAACNGFRCGNNDEILWEQLFYTSEPNTNADQVDNPRELPCADVPWGVNHHREHDRCCLEVYKTKTCYRRNDHMIGNSAHGAHCMCDNANDHRAGKILPSNFFTASQGLPRLLAPDRRLGSGRNGEVMLYNICQEDACQQQLHQLTQDADGAQMPRLYGREQVAIKTVRAGGEVPVQEVILSVMIEETDVPTLSGFLGFACWPSRHPPAANPNQKQVCEHSVLCPPDTDLISFMRLVGGSDLGSASHRANNPISCDLVGVMRNQVSAACTAMWQQFGIHQGDMHPWNIMWDDHNQRLTILDFGAGRFAVQPGGNMSMRRPLALTADNNYPKTHALLQKVMRFWSVCDWPYNHIMSNLPAGNLVEAALRKANYWGKTFLGLCSETPAMIARQAAADEARQVELGRLGTHANIQAAKNFAKQQHPDRLVGRQVSVRTAAGGWSEDGLIVDTRPNMQQKQEWQILYKDNTHHWLQLRHSSHGRSKMQSFHHLGRQGPDSNPKFVFSAPVGDAPLMFPEPEGTVALFRANWQSRRDVRNPDETNRWIRVCWTELVGGCQVGEIIEKTISHYGVTSETADDAFEACTKDGSKCQSTDFAFAKQFAQTEVPFHSSFNRNNHNFQEYARRAREKIGKHRDWYEKMGRLNGQWLFPEGGDIWKRADGGTGRNHEWRVRYEDGYEQYHSLLIMPNWHFVDVDDGSDVDDEDY